MKQKPKHCENTLPFWVMNLKTHKKERVPCGTKFDGEPQFCEICQAKQQTALALKKKLWQKFINEHRKYINDGESIFDEMCDESEVELINKLKVFWNKIWEEEISTPALARESVGRSAKIKIQHSPLKKEGTK